MILKNVTTALKAVPQQLVQSYTFIFRKQFYSVVSGLKIIGHGNPDNNLESPCILIVLIDRSI